jgi:hypothetical protein
VLEPPTYDHVSDRGGHELLQEPFLALFVEEISREILPLVAQPDPGVGLQHLPHVFQLVVGRDLVEFIELALEHLLVEGRLFQLG